MRWLCVLVLLLGGIHAQSPTLKILSERLNTFFLNGQLKQNNTITVQCTDSDYGVFRYVQITKPDGTTQLLGVRCNAPTYTFTKTLIGYVPVDGIQTVYSNCLVQNTFNIDPASMTAADFSRAPSNPAQLVAQSIHHRKHLELTRPGHFTAHRKFFWLPILAVGFVGGIAGAAMYCALGGCGGGGADEGRMNDLQAQIKSLDANKDQLNANLKTLQGQVTDLWSNQSAFATETAKALRDTTTLFTTQLGATQNTLDAQRNTTDQLQYIVNNLDVDLGNIKTKLGDTQTAISTLTDTVTAGFNVSAGNLAAVVRDMNIIVANITSRIDDVSQRCYTGIGHLRKQLEQLIAKTQAQITQLVHISRNTQARQALAEFVHSHLQGVVDDGYTPFLLNLGIAPSPDTEPLVWRINIETSRVMYIRNSAGLTAQQLDISWYCNTQKMIAFGDSIASFQDILRQFGPWNCNATIANNCTCWATTQRVSCPTTAPTYTASNWFNKTDLRDSDVCSGAVTTGALTSHVTFDSLLLVIGAVCGDGTYNNTDLRVLSGQLARSASIPVNSVVCSLEYDTIIDAVATGLNFVYASLFYLQLAFSKVYVSIDKYASYIYGVIPDGITTKEDPLAVINGTDARCFYSSFVSYDTGVEPMQPVYQLTYVSTEMTVTMTVDNVTLTDVTDITKSVPADITLPPTGSIMVGEPADPSVCYNIPYSATSVSPASVARCGMPTYGIIDHPSNFTLAGWGTQNRAIFDHFCATSFPSYYRRSLTVGGLCTGTALAGEGALCTMRENFVVSSITGGVRYQPQTNTGSSGIVQLVVTQGNLTSLIFSECPSVSLEQTAPNVATLTLGNPRPDADITVAIVLGGDCVATTSSFTIPQNKQRDFLVPVCNGNTVSARTISIFRYDSNSDLQLCGSTTNFTIDRQTYVNTFTTPDQIKVNITTQISSDNNQIALMNSLNDLRDIMAMMALAPAQAIVSVGLQLNQSLYDDYTNILNRLSLNAQTTATLLNDTRNLALYNYTNGFAAYAANTRDSLLENDRLLNDSRALLEDLRLRVYNAESYAANIAAITVNVTATYALVTELTINQNNIISNISHLTYDAINSIGGNPGGFLSFLDGMGDIILSGAEGAGKWLQGSIEYLAKAAVGTLDFIRDFMLKGLGDLLGIAGNLFAPLFWGVIGVAALIAAYMIYQKTAFADKFKNPQQLKIDKGTFSYADLAPATYQAPPPPNYRPPPSQGAPPQQQTNPYNAPRDIEHFPEPPTQPQPPIQMQSGTVQLKPDAASAQAVLNRTAATGQVPTFTVNGNVVKPDAASIKAQATAAYSQFNATGQAPTIAMRGNNSGGRRRTRFEDDGEEEHTALIAKKRRPAIHVDTHEN